MNPTKRRRLASTENAITPSENEMDMYRYEPMENPKSDIRLVTIEWCFNDRDDLRCRISTYDTDSNSTEKPPPYRALSYAWGDASNKVPITLNNKVFLVTSNLSSALRSLRMFHESTNDNSVLVWSTPLWIDAICIDQENIDERDEQVRRMKDIYQKANEVFIWLGGFREPSDNDLQPSMAKWGLNAQERADAKSTREMFEMVHRISKYGNNPPLISGDLARRYKDAHWAQLAMLFRRAWFQRLWIIQELAAARDVTVLCGTQKIKWLDIEKAAAWILHQKSNSLVPRIKRILPNIGAHIVFQVSLNSMANIDVKNILTVLNRTQDAQCTDPRDRLFAILGVVEDTSDIDIDYSISVAATYRNWARKRIGRTQTLDILGACADSGRSGELPSWVPDLRNPWGQDKQLWVWSFKDGGLHGLQGKQMMYKSFQAQKDPQNPSVKMSCVSEDGLQLSVAGHFLDKIASVSGVADATIRLSDPTDIRSRLVDIIRDWERWLYEQGARYFETSFREVILRELFIDQWSLSVQKHQAKAELAEDYRVWRACFLEQSKPTFLFPSRLIHPEKREGALREFERKLFPRVHGCQIFISANGLIGIVAGNCNSQPGDGIWRLDGALTPMILRQSTPGYRVISPCFLAGGMESFRDFRHAIGEFEIPEFITLV